MERRRAGSEPDDVACSTKAIAKGRIVDDRRGDGHNRGSRLIDRALERGLLRGMKGILAALPEDRRTVAARRGENLSVVVEERPAEPDSDRLRDGRLAGAHHPD